MRMKAVFIGLLVGYLVILPLSSPAQPRRGQGTAPVRPPTSSRYHALLIGVQAYRDSKVNPLDYPLKDAQQLQQVLTTYYSFDPQNVLLLKNPDRETILTALNQFAETMGANDNLLIFYAGHGYWDKERRQGYWLPSDAQQGNISKWISNSDLRDAIRALKVRHTLLISDACFSGSIFITTREAFTPSAAIEAATRLPSRNAMTSGALTSVPDRSVFIEYLLKRLRENSEAYLLASDLYYQLRTPVMNNSPRQPDGEIPTPKFGVIHEAGDEGGEFVFVRRMNVTAIASPPPVPASKPTSIPPSVPASVPAPAPKLAEKMRQAEYSLRRSDFAEAISVAETILDADPGNAVAQRFRAEAYFFSRHDEGRLEREKAEIYRLLKSPQNASEYEALCWVQLNEDIQSAISACTQAIRLDPGYISAYVSRGIAYTNNREYDRAIADFNEALRRDRKYVKAYLRCGDLHVEKGDYNHAKEDFDEVLNLTRNFADAYFYHAKIHCARSECDKAMEDLNEAIRLAPMFVEAYLHRAKLHCSNGDCDRALADLNQAIRLRPNSAAAYNHRGEVYERKREYYRAIEDFTAAIRLAPQFGDAYSGRARAYRKIGRGGWADADERKASSLKRNR